ncbi:MAG: glycosyltransferase family 4 protein, partial [Gammaproteobacteria bacterium]|nr:glycosyltransferase family 4 protein [Gammaproteobacteria bacterium]NIR82506.1 glycosyltransferase family 4 protein [Gammaproteobacteria bacterium]NIV77143.1 glycosyltransferase family 4 protein [Gammaproteobacteria bacterium]
VADRIRRHYGRRADVVYPPVDVDRFRPAGRSPEDFYLLVGGFVPYK